MQVNVATKSGSNEFHGVAWEFNQNDAYNARNTFATIPRLGYAAINSAALSAAR